MGVVVATGWVVVTGRVVGVGGRVVVTGASVVDVVVVAGGTVVVVVGGGRVDVDEVVVVASVPVDTLWCGDEHPARPKEVAATPATMTLPMKVLSMFMPTV